MFDQPQAEHEWLQQLVGEWTSEMESFGPECGETKSHGREVVRSLGGLWTIGEGEGEMPDGAKGYTIMTLGYDLKKQAYVGTFVGSMMSYLWIYEGRREGNKLLLPCKGPKFEGEGLANYRDEIEFLDGDHRTLKAFQQGDDGQWNHFMTAHYTRVK